MKYLTSLLVAALLLSSCTNPSTPQSSQSVTPPAGKGIITVGLPGSARSLDFAYAKANSNFYEVIAYNATNVYYGRTTDIANTVSIAVPAGTYNVVALAGYKTVSVAVLFGSGSASGVVVTNGATTNATVTMTNVTFHYTAPATTQVIDNPFTFYAWGDLGVSQLSFTPANGYPIITRGIPTGTNGLTAVKDAAKTGSSWGATYTVPTAVPAGVESFYVKGGSNIIYLVDATMSRSSTIGAITTVTWMFPGLGVSTGEYLNSWDILATDASTIEQFAFDVNWTVGSTGGGFTLGWGEANPN